MFAVALVAALMVTLLAVPGFAMETREGPSPRTNIFTTQLTNIGYQANMNCSGNTSNYNNRDVNLCYRIAGSSDQSWTFDSIGNNYYIKSGTSDAGGNVYALNLYGYSGKYYLNCDVMKLIGNERDAKINYITVSGSPMNYNTTIGLQHAYYTQYYAGVKTDPDNKAPYGYTVCWSTGSPYSTSALQWKHTS